MTELQNNLLDMLKWFHNYCDKFNLQYYIIGGTALGAARHKGFIPWDDDIDLGMPRNDYNTLMASIGNEVIDDQYKLETPLSSKEFIYPFCKLYNINTTLIENTKHKIKRGIYLDIFPLDGVGNSLDKVVKNYKKIKRLHNLLILKVTGFRKGRKLYKNLGVALFRMLPIKEKTIINKIVRKSAKYSFQESIYVANLVGSWGIKEIVPKAVIGKPTLYEFEDTKVFGVENPDEYLTSIYGDWRKLPPLNKQKSHHDYVELNLNKSYLKK